MRHKRVPDKPRKATSQGKQVEVLSLCCLTCQIICPRCRALSSGTRGTGTLDVRSGRLTRHLQHTACDPGSRSFGSQVRCLREVHTFGAMPQTCHPNVLWRTLSTSGSRCDVARERRPRVANISLHRSMYLSRTRSSNAVACWPDRPSEGCTARCEPNCDFC
jgi:hypothetical protein